MIVCARWRVAARSHEMQVMALTRPYAEFAARAISAVVLGSIAVLALWIGSATFVVLVLAFALAMCWEWGRAVRGTSLDRIHLLHAAAVIAACVMTFLSATQTVAILAIIAIGTVAVYAMSGRHMRWMSALGVPYVGLPAAVLIWFRLDEPHGFVAVLFIFCVVWAHDTFAMLVGKLVGGPRLWPVLTPNKTWAGVAGGLVASAAVGAIFAALLVAADGLLLATTGFLLGLASLAGDLVESAFKRNYHLKHASGLIPGHGGVLDRLDGAVLAANMSAVIALVIAPQAPARAILFWA